MLIEPLGLAAVARSDEVGVDTEVYVRFPHFMNSPAHSSAPSRRLTLSAVVATLSVVFGCSTNIVDSNVTWAETSAEALEIMAKPRGTFGIAGTPRAAWVDPRGEAEFKAERIPGAINLPFARIEAEHMVAFKDKDVLIIYDSDSDSALALTYAKRLLALGYKDVYCMRGGLKAWKRDGNMTDKG